MEEDILNYSPTVMFRGTPCILFFFIFNGRTKKERRLEFGDPDSYEKFHQFLRPGRLFQIPALYSRFVFLFTIVFLQQQTNLNL